nr:MAG TPA: hypothetical protein [Caudoviricetes sp.]
MCLSKNLTKYVATTPLTMPVTIVKINNSINVTLLSSFVSISYMMSRGYLYKQNITVLT